MPEETPEQDPLLGIDDSIVAPDETLLLRARKRIDTVRVQESVTRAGEDLDLERLPVAADDPGGVLTLADGGLSIPIYEEEVVVTKRVVLKERVVIRKRIETHTTPVNTELRRELVEIDIDESLKDRVRVVDEEPGGAARSR